VCLEKGTSYKVADGAVGSLRYPIQFRGVGRPRLVGNTQELKIGSEIIGDVFSLVVGLEGSDGVGCGFLK
jgi:hypothetical protein